MTLTIRRMPGDAPLGAEVTGADLAQEADDSTFGQIEDALHEHLVVVVRDQKLTPEQHIRFSRRFGALADHVMGPYVLPGHPEIYVVSNIIENGKPIGVADAGPKWHSDFVYRARPARCSLLYALEVPVIEGVPRGDTYFSNTAAAYAALPAQTRERLDKLKAVFCFTRQYEQRIKDGASLLPLTAEQKAAAPDVVHPVVRTHPYTGRRCIYACEMNTANIDGVPAEESDRLLGEVYRQVAREDFVYRHKWRVGDLVIWDNVSAQHRAAPKDYALPYRRHMHRTTVRGHTPF
jgi:taurine dioxygenase